MDTIAEVQKYLKQYRNAKADLIIKKQTLEELEEDALSLPQVSGGEVRSNMPSDRVGNYAVRLAQFKQKIETERLDTLEKLNDVKNMIEGLDHEKTKIVLGYKYIKGYSIRQTANNTNLTERQVISLLRHGEKEVSEKIHVQKKCCTL